VEEVAPGLRRWTRRHPDWEEEVASLAVESDDGLILIDPIDPPRGLRRPEHILLTVFWHHRSTGELNAKHVWSPGSARALANRGVEVTDVFRAGDELPGGVQAFATARANEVVYWLTKQRALAVGDVLLGAGAKPRATDEPLRLCPERWLGAKATHADLRASLAPLLELPVSRVLVSHGEPILRNGKRALTRVIRSPRGVANT
jgi:glyoxylase-like metal-dependent hydrolase (beta-lactamase superfamily II)